MNKYNLFLALTIFLVIVLLGSAGCFLAATTQTNTSITTEGDNLISTVPTEPEDAKGSTPIAAAPSDNAVIGNDPISGQNEEVDLRWEQLCLSTEYQVQIAKDPGFTIIVLDTGSFAPASSQSPAAYYPAGGQATSPSSLTTLANLEAGHTYYWRARARQAATGQQMVSPWSEAQSFTIKSGSPTSTSSYGIQPIYPNNGGNIYPVKSVSFSWSPLNNTSKYKFVLAKDTSMTQVVQEAVVNTTAYNYDGELEYSQSYFWRIMALEPAPSDWSATFSFQTEAAPLVAAEPTSEPIPVWAWVVIVVGLILLIVIIVLIFRMRHR